MARKLVFSFIAYDHHGELLGYMQQKPQGTGLCTVHHPSGKIMFVRSNEIGRYENYNLQALTRIAEKEQKKEKAQLKETMI